MIARLIPYQSASNSEFAVGLSAISVGDPCWLARKCANYPMPWWIRKKFMIQDNLLY